MPFAVWLGFALACSPTRPSADGDTDDTDSSASSTDGSTVGPTSDPTNPDPSAGFLDTSDWNDDGLECDPFVQDCPEGEKCTAYSNDGSSNPNARKCVPLIGDGVAGQACIWAGPEDATDDCDAAHACYLVAGDDAGEFVGTCTAFCEGTADDPSCPDTLSCYIGINQAPLFCLPTCLPLAQDCADANAVCQWGMTEFVCLQRGADVAVGQPCEFVTDCAAGSLCLDASIVPGCTGDSCCGPYCELGMVGGCDSLPGTTCAPFFDDPPPPGHETLGVCL